MASISRALERVKQDLARLVPPAVIEQACRDAGHNYRKRKLDPVTTVHLFVQQVLNHNAALTELPRLAGFDFDPGAYCVARKRLPLAVLLDLLRRTADAVRDDLDTPGGGGGGGGPRGLWLGRHRTWLIDGSSCSMPDTPALQKEFGQPAAQKEGCGFPTAHLLAMFDAYSGMLLAMLAAPWRTSDFSVVDALHPRVVPGDVVVGDRGFCSYAHVATLSGKGVHAVFRAHQKLIIAFRDTPEPTRNLKPDKGGPRSRLVRKLGEEDQVVEWYKPQERPGWMDAAAFDALPASVLVRELRYRAPVGCRTTTVTLVTTLLDERAYPKAELARLYGVRWAVEQDLRHLKTTMRMDVLKCKTPDGVRKELAVYAIVYNLACLVREEAARRQEVEPRRVSFVDVLRWLRTAEPGAGLPRFVLVPLRPDRHEPRVLKRRQKEYARMTRPRSAYKKAG